MRFLLYITTFHFVDKINGFTSIPWYVHHICKGHGTYDCVCVWVEYEGVWAETENRDRGDDKKSTFHAVLKKTTTT